MQQWEWNSIVNWLWNCIKCCGMCVRMSLCCSVAFSFYMCVCMSQFLYTCIVWVCARSHCKFQKHSHLSSTPQKLCVSFHSLSCLFYFVPFGMFLTFLFRIYVYIYIYTYLPFLFCSVLKIACCQFTRKSVLIHHIPSNECAVARSQIRIRTRTRKYIEDFCRCIEIMLLFHSEYISHSFRTFTSQLLSIPIPYITYHLFTPRTFLRKR